MRYMRKECEFQPRDEHERSTNFEINASNAICKNICIICTFE